MSKRLNYKNKELWKQHLSEALKGKKKNYIISESTRQKMSIAAKKRLSNKLNHHAFGKHLSIEIKEKIRNKLLHHVMSAETKQKLSLIKKQYYLTHMHPSYGKHHHHTEETKRKISIASIGKKKTDETRKKMSIVQTGKKLSDITKKKLSVSQIGHKAHFSKQILYNDIYFKSSWEILFAKYLNSRNIKWKYEPKRFFFENKNFTYLPDFYLTDFNRWVEIRGWLKNNEDLRITEFQKMHDNFVLLRCEHINIIRELLTQEGIL